MNRIDKIKEYKKAQEAEEKKKSDEKRSESISLEAEIRNLSARIRDLIETANACLENGIEINKWSKSFSSYFDSYSQGTFVTNSITHRIGFVHIPGEEVKMLGINAGGACGSWHFRTNGFEVYSEDAKDKNLKTTPMIQHMNEFIKGFDKFEKAFYEYVDAIVGK